MNETFVRSVIYLAGLLGGSAVAMPLGGVVSALLSGTFFIPKVGPLLVTALNGWVRVSVLFKLAAWSISSFGMVAAYVRVIGEPSGTYEWSAVATAALIVVMNISYRIIMFQPLYVPSPDDVAALVSGDLAKTLENLPEQQESALIRAAFVDLNITAVIQLVSCFGLLIFAALRLGFIATLSGAATPDLKACLLIAFSALNISATSDVPLVGGVWIVLRCAIGVVLLVWGAAFVGFGLEWLPKLKSAADPSAWPVDPRLAHMLAEIASESGDAAASEDQQSGAAPAGGPQMDEPSAGRKKKRRRRKSRKIGSK